MDVRAAVDAIWRIESPRIVAGLMRIVKDVGVAEDVAQDALVSALERWPESGVPENPGAWLAAVAKRRAFDLLRRRRRFERKKEDIVRSRGKEPEDLDAALDDDIGDDLLRLVFLTCHPALSPESRVVLTLRLVGGLTTAEIARAYLAAEPAIAQRIVRAKRTLAGTPFEVPRGAELAERLSAVLGVLYLMFNEGYAATAGESWTRPELCFEALRLARVLAALMPREREVHGLAALMEFQASRLRARATASGGIVRLLDQDRTRWDGHLIRRGFAALARAQELGPPYGPRVLEAAIAACHARARTPDATDWPRIVDLYGQLARAAPSPVVELNRAVAVSMVSGPEAGLALADALASSLAGYHLFAAVRGDFLEKLGRRDEARAEFERAAAMTRNARERDLRLARARSIG